MDGANIGEPLGACADQVRRLLSLGEPAGMEPDEWLDYQTAFGFGAAHVDALVRLGCDVDLNSSDADGPEVWAPVHAWRALGQLRAEAAVAPLLKLLNAIDGGGAAGEELPFVFAAIGPAAIPHLVRCLDDRSNSGHARETAIAGIKLIAREHPQYRAECVDILARQLEPAVGATPVIAALAIWALLDLKAVEAIEPIRNAFERDAVDLSYVGDLEDAEIALGLREQRATPLRRYNAWGNWLPQADPAPRWQAESAAKIVPVSPRNAKVARNEPCPCGSGRKYKKCCMP